MRLNVSPTVLAEKIAKDLGTFEDIKCKFFETSDNVPDPRDPDSSKNNLDYFR